MFRRLETRGLPGQPADRLLFWDFHGTPDPEHTPEPGDAPRLRWQLELQAWASGRWRRPEQARWLADHHFRVPAPGERVDLRPETLRRLTDALSAVAVVPWAALETRDSVLSNLQSGQARAALEAVQALSRLAPDWVDGRVLELEVLVRQGRNPDRAEALLHALPEGTIAPDAARRIRQSIAILRNDWDRYAAEVHTQMEEGERPWWNFEILGLAYWAGGRLDEAIATFAQGMAEHDHHPDLALRHVEVLAAAGRTDEALQALLPLLAQPEPPAKAFALRGWLRRSTDADAAAIDYRKALTIDPEQAVARVGRGLLRWAEGDLDGARSDLEPFRYSGWQDAWDAWTHFCAATGLEPGPHPTQLGHEHDHQHDHADCSHP